MRDWILWVANFRFPFSEICVQNQWCINCLDSVENSNTGGPSSITVRMEYFRAFQYGYCKLFLEKRWDRKHCFVNFLFFGGAWIFGGWGVVGWGSKSYLGPAEIVSFSTRSFSHLNQIWLKCKIPLLFFLIIFYYISFDQQSSADVPKNFLNVTGKYLCWSLFLIKLQALRPPFLLKRYSNTGGFFFQISKIFKNTFFKEHLQWLLLYILYTHDVTCNRSRWNNGYNNGNYKKDEKKL